MQTDQINLLGLNQHQLESFFVSIGEKPFRSKQILKWVYQQRQTNFDQMTNLSKDLRHRLGKIAYLDNPKIISEQIAIDSTRKWLLELKDGNCIETVFIPEEKRGTLCVSSQVGCMLTCQFCATARVGFNRNLTTSEIIAQLLTADRHLAKTSSNAISNIVMMGMGEPLLNYDNVVQAIKLMRDDNCYGLSKRKITLSTAGVVPAIYKLKQDCPVSLAVSLHACEDDLRNKLVPINKKYPIDQLLSACADYVSEHKRRRVTFEYIMLDSINDSEQQAILLAKKLKNIPSKINLIPFNPVPGIEFKCSSNNKINRFRDILVDKGIVTIVRKTRGEDIDAACGQLAGNITDRTRRSNNLSVNFDHKVNS